MATWVFGTAPERALRQATTAAVRLTAAELCPQGDEQTEELARVISQVFSEAVPDSPLPRLATVLETLREGIDRQLAVLDDVSLTGTKRSSSEALGIPGTVLAAKLTEHLLYEIHVRGARNASLAPLASQLNHDAAHLQSQALQDHFSRLTAEVREWHQLEVSRQTTTLAEQGQVADRCMKAIEQLGAPELVVRVGGIYALERIARDSSVDHPVIMEVLAAFIREKRPRGSSGAQSEAAGLATLLDVQAAVTVIGRRNIDYDSRQIDLSGTDLSAASLKSTNFAGADLSFVDLSGADLTRANLGRADLCGAVLSGARLIEADMANADLMGAELGSADLVGADLTGAELAGASLVWAYLARAKLIGAKFNATDLANADLRDADLTNAQYLGHSFVAGPNFTGARLDSAIVPPDARLPEGWARDPDSGELKQTITSSRKPRSAT
jgi:uncharacterized protein YjbI with pentapeptide repeats